MWDYSEKVIDHFLHPRNIGEIENADGRGEVGSMACGDMLLLTFKLDDKKETIVDAKFKTFGCASAIASSSVITEMIKGKTIKEAQKITNKDIAEFLGGLPNEKMHCSVLGKEALEAAIENYKTGNVATKRLEGKIVCECFGITENEIVKAIEENNLTTLEEVTNFTKAGGACGNCHENILELLKTKKISTKILGTKTTPHLSTLEKVRKIDALIAETIRPALKHDGGDVELVDIEGDVVLVRLKGACSSCPSSDKTMRRFIEKEIQKEVSPYLRVKRAK